MINFNPDEEDLAMETYRTWVHLFELQRFYSWIVDRFHLSTIMYQWMTYHKKYDFAWLEECLIPLNFRLVFCTRSEDSFQAAREERLKVSGNPKQYDDLQLFIEEQNVMRDLVTASALPFFEVDVSDSNVSRAADAIADWLQESGGLYMDVI